MGHYENNRDHYDNNNQNHNNYNPKPTSFRGNNEHNNNKCVWECMQNREKEIESFSVTVEDSNQGQPRTTPNSFVDIDHRWTTATFPPNPHNGVEILNLLTAPPSDHDPNNSDDS